MAGGSVRETNVWQQTIALLRKNLLLKWRRKWHSVLEWLQDLAYVLLMFLVASTAYTAPHNDVSPYEPLGRVDAFKSTNFTVGYVRTAPTAREIMRRVAESGDLRGLTVQEFEDEDALLSEVKNQTAVAVVFHHPFQYHIRFSVMDISSPNDYISHQGDCFNMSYFCTSTYYWSTGFLFLQARIDSAIIQMTTNHTVQERLASIMASRMSSTRHFYRIITNVGIFVFGMCLSFVSMTYLLSLYVTRERMEMSAIMKTMMLKDQAFWLSWGLLYLVYIIIIANLMTLVTQYYVFTNSSYGVILLLFILYGIASICVTFMLSALFRNPRVTAIAGFFLTLFMSALGLLLLTRNLPKAVEVLLCIFPPFAFSVGLMESVHLENDLQGVFFTDMMGSSSHVLSCCVSLVLDSVLYALLTLYFSKILPDKNGMRYEALFFLRSSYWSGEKDTPPKLQTRGTAESDYGEYIEKVPSTFQGREVIRIHNVRKTYQGEEQKVEALRGLDFDIYEGQITALLGHSGAGKTTLLNILSGMCRTTTGSAFIYNYNPSDMSHLEQIHKRVGFCPQFDVKFDPLTVKENLKVFAQIKGTPSGSVDQEVQKVIYDLRLIDVQNLEASKLSGGQKRKLSLGIAILGDPQVLILDEPTAGLDPCSRHHVWAMLKERKGDRVTLLSTQFMDEADILADRKAVLSSGRLKCMGSSLFLKRKWGIGYHLRMLVSPLCDPEVIMSQIQQHVSGAKLSAKSEQELTFTLPFENMDAFPDLFSHLDGLMGGEISSYGVSVTTLNDVFLKLEGEAEIEGGDYEVFRQEISEEDKDILNSEMEDSVQLMSDAGSATVSGMMLWKQQVTAIARVHFLRLKHDMKGFRALLLLIFLFLIPIIAVFAIRHKINASQTWELRPDLYFLRPGDRDHRYYSSLLINNNTGSPIEDFIATVKAQNIVVEVIDGPYVANMTTYKGAIEVSGKDEGYRYTIVGNPRARNALPVLMNVISNSLLKTFQSNEHIQAWSSPVSWDDHQDILQFFASLSFVIFGAGLAPHFAMSSIEDTGNKARSQLRISGLFPSAYWCGQALVDIPLYWFLLFLMIAILFAFNHKTLLDFWVVCLLVTNVLGYGVAIVLYVYVISFLFRRGKSHHDRWAFFFVMTSFIPRFLVDIGFYYFYPAVSFLYMFIFPPSVLNSLLLSIGAIEEHKFYQEEEELSSQIYHSILVSFLHIFLFWWILWFLEWRYGTRSLTKDPVFSAFLVPVRPTAFLSVPCVQRLQLPFVSSRHLCVSTLPADVPSVAEDPLPSICLLVVSSGFPPPGVFPYLPFPVAAPSVVLLFKWSLGLCGLVFGFCVVRWFL